MATPQPHLPPTFPRTARRSFRLRPFYICAVLLTLLAGSARADDAGTSGTGPAPNRSRQVEAAIEKAKAFLYSAQHNGNWEEVDKRDESADDYATKGAQWGGLTALSTYALLAAGESPQSEKIARAVKFLEQVPLIGTYAIAMRAQVWAMLPHPLPQGAKAVLTKDGDYLLKAIRGGEERGFYHYRLNDESYDHSCSQYGVLGMWGCEQAGYEVPIRYWQEVEAAWQREQDRGGGWCYQLHSDDDNDKKVKPSMTAAGVATLFITQDYLHADAGIDCRGNIHSPNLEAGLKWMGDNFSLIRPDADFYDYTLYGVERIGVASGYKYFGSVDWYARGSESLLKTQDDNGSFGDGVPDTCFAILFLVRGRAPVVLNKLEYALAAPHPAGAKPHAPAAMAATEANWNQRPRDAANVTRWLAGQTERDLNWQIVNLAAPVDELHDAPILYVAGNQAISFTDDQGAKLRQFIEEGGMVLGNSDCGNGNFSNAFKKLGSQLFPAYEFRELPANHLIYTNQWPRTKWKHPPSVLGMSNGVRELMLLVPQADFARSWQTRAIAGHEEGYQLLGNIFLYAVDKKDLRFKGETYIVRPDSAVKAQQSIAVARLQYAGNWDPEPAGWRQIAALLHNRSRIDLVAEPVKLGAGNLNAGRFKLAHLTGTAAFKFNEQQRGELKSFIAGGGTLFIDSAGGASAFADSAESELDALFAAPGTHAYKPLGDDHPVYTAAGTKSEPVGYRRFAQLALGKLKGPRLQGVQVAGRTAVFYSREDISAGLVGQPIDGILGYDPQTAANLAADIVLFITRAKGAKP